MAWRVGGAYESFQYAFCIAQHIPKSEFNGRGGQRIVTLCCGDAEQRQPFEHVGMHDDEEPPGKELGENVRLFRW